MSKAHSFFKVIAVVLFVAIIIGLISLIRSCNQAKQTVSTIKTISQIDSTPIKYWQDMYGKEHAQVQIAKVTARDMSLLYQGKWDSLKRALKLKDRQIIALTNATAKFTGGGYAKTDTLYIPDTNGRLNTVINFCFNDDVINICGTHDSLGTKVDYTGVLQANVTSYWRRKWFLGRRRYYIDVSGNSDKVQIIGLKGYLIK